MITHGTSPHLPGFVIDPAYQRNACAPITHTAKHEDGVLVYLMFKASDGTWRDIGYVGPENDNVVHHIGYARAWGERIALDYDIQPIQWSDNA